MLIFRKEQAWKDFQTLSASLDQEANKPTHMFNMSLNVSLNDNNQMLEY